VAWQAPSPLRPTSRLTQLPASAGVLPKGSGSFAVTGVRVKLGNYAGLGHY
jgi:hypothetical protein